MRMAGPQNRAGRPCTNRAQCPCPRTGFIAGSKTLFGLMLLHQFPPIFMHHNFFIIKTAAYKVAQNLLYHRYH